MLEGKKQRVSFRKITEDTFNKAILQSKSVVGHKPIADMIGVETNRESILLNKGDVLYCVLAKANRLNEKHPIITDKDEFNYIKCKI